MLVPGQAAGLSVRRALCVQQQRQEARLPCEHTAPSFMAKNSPPGCGPAWKSPLQPRPAHVYSVRGGDALPSPCPLALHAVSLPERPLLDTVPWVPPGQNTQAGVGRGGGGGGKPLKSTGFVSGRSSPGDVMRVCKRPHERDLLPRKSTGPRSTRQASDSSVGREGNLGEPEPSLPLPREQSMPPAP